MNRRIEFSLNLDNPQEAAIYEVLSALLRRRRAGEVIRQALTAHLFGEVVEKPWRPAPDIKEDRNGAMAVPALDSSATEQIVEQSAAMFGF